MSNQINISIVVPIFNEEESIGQLVSEVLNAMKTSKENFEIILVNDGSKDKTGQILDVIKSEQKVKVSGVNVAKKHRKPSKWCSIFKIRFLRAPWMK